MESGTIDPMQIEAEAFLPTEYGDFCIRGIGLHEKIKAYALQGQEKGAYSPICF